MMVDRVHRSNTPREADTMANAKDTMAKAFNTFHRSLFDITKGRIGGKAFGMPVVKLTTKGAKSGVERTVMLTSPVQQGEGVVLVASYGGDDRHPAWYHNLKANPEVTVVMSGSRRTLTARTATAEEKAELWPKVTAAYKGYAGYQTKTDRDIPLVILEA